MRRPSSASPSRLRSGASWLRRAWLALGLAAIGVLAWRLWPSAPEGEPGVVIALPSEPETIAPAPRGDEAPPVVEVPAEADDAAAGIPVVARADVPPAGAAGRTNAPGGVRITLPGTGAAEDPGIPASPAALPPAAPNPALVRRTADGQRPGVGPDGQTPFSAYRRLQPVREGGDVAVLVGGLGFDAGLTARAVALPPEVTLSFVPYAKGVAAQMEAARAAGHEVVMELPMSQSGASAQTLGPAALDPARGASGNEKRLSWLLARSPAYPMVTNYLGRDVAADSALAAQVMARLSEAGLAYLDDTGRLEGAARAAGVPYAAVDVLAGPGEAAAALSRAGRTVTPGEVRLVKLYATPEALSALEAFAAEAPLAPASSKVTAR